jgi:bacterial/archaeal transporter family-2 protein
MFTRFLFWILVAAGGAALTLQVAWNALLRIGTGSPVLTILISISVTLVSLVALWTTGIMPRGTVPAFNSVPKWAWFGGVCAGYYLIASLIALPKVGAAAVFSLVIAGQLITALILDSTGAFGVPHIGLTPTRIIGVALLLVGVALVQKG